MKVPFFGKKASQKIEELDSVILDLKVETNMTSKKIDQLQKQMVSLMKKGLGASKQEKNLLGIQIKSVERQAVVLRRKLQHDTTVYGMATLAKGMYESQELETEGALKALQKILGAKNLTELRTEMGQLSKIDAKLGAKLVGMEEQLDQMTEEMNTSAEMTNNDYVKLMEEMEKLPPEKLDETINATLQKAERTA